MQIMEKYEAPWIVDLIADIYCEDTYKSVVQGPGDDVDTSEFE